MINVRQLTIGSHVSVDGKRERIRGIDEDNGLIIRFPAKYVNVSEVEPIAITTELLEELGFEKEPNVDRKRHFDYLWTKKDEDSDVCWLYGKKDNFFLLQIGAFGQLNVKFLHEAEAFLALRGVELIKE